MRNAKCTTKNFKVGHCDVNFMYQLDWATRCPDIWANIIQGNGIGLIQSTDVFNKTKRLTTILSLPTADLVTSQPP